MTLFAKPPMGRPPMGRPSNARGSSIQIGLNRVDKDKYGGWEGTLHGCINDANAMRQIAGDAGFSVAGAPLIDAAATADAVLDAIAAAARRARPGDTVLLTFSGHGGQLPDVTGDEPDGQDETWVLYDRMLLDDELRGAFTAFSEGVRIVVVSDCCHSGSDADAVVAHERCIPTETLGAHIERNRDSYALLERATRSYGDPAASVLLLSACRDTEIAMDDDDDGAFTKALCAVWDRGAYRGDYREFRAAIQNTINAGQHPNLMTFGGGDLPAFESQRPFTIAAAEGSGESVATSFSANEGRAVTVTVRVELG